MGDNKGTVDIVDWDIWCTFFQTILPSITLTEIEPPLEIRQDKKFL